MTSIYLAGPDVFRPDAGAYGESLKAACRAHGFEGLYPLDNAVPHGLPKPEAAAWICQANLGLIQRADIVMANLNPFRGAEPDSGTVFEVGYATALGKPVWGYADDIRAIAQRVVHTMDPDGRLVDPQGLQVEDFGLPLNLMLACSIQVVRGGPDDCLAEISRVSRFSNQ
ncbi:MAG: nucleoside 2-deoxyribosyltransferase [Castellaniella sp.]|uniref:nucleoside 2-deoxyribosyltransferase n=1 Tax=Castellaniella sp. TaxID=1955812 RepID=UPI0012114406|nr:nucleoside 2-deoxyribosyltransferase [Castellaniella sp.]TAN27381.1 MAG: nucleoside 2-deoxyribosyltransferase [Castellaniella sp.]